MDKRCAAYCIDLIRCLMQEKPIPQIPEGVSLEDLYAFAKLHGVEAMVFHGLELLDMDEKDPVWQDWRKRTDMLLAQSIVQLTERDALFAALPAAGIPILPVKGCWLKERYPQIDYRQMSDLDILIPKQDASLAAQVMERLGYTGEEEGADHHSGYTKLPFVSVELHTALLRKENLHHIYYKNVWKKATSDNDGYVYRLSPEDAYIYYMLHMMNHVLYAGTGIRTFLDSVVYRRSCPNMDRAYLEKEFRKLGIHTFARTAEKLADCWFVTGEAVPEKYEALEESIFAAGTYGREATVGGDEIVVFRYPLRFRVSAFWARVFPDREDLAQRYPVLNRLPFLLPLFWLIRIVRVAVRSVTKTPAR